MPFIIGKKIEMTQIFQGNKVAPVTLIQAGPCVVTQIKTKDKEGTDAVQIGFIAKTKHIGKSEKGKEYKHIVEFKGEVGELKQGSEITANVFKPGDKVRVSGMSKGKGFQGGVKKWGFKGMGASHGVKHHHRTIGSVGSTGPAKVFKGKKMPGRMGYDRKTVDNLEVVKIDIENNIIALKGAVPGRRGTLIEIRGL